MNVEDYGVKKSWDGWRTFAYVRDGTPMGLMPITDFLLFTLNIMVNV